MNRYTITITTLSDTLFAASEGSAAVDSTTRYHKNGLPYIPAKTFKGLLKESAIECLEIMDESLKENYSKDIISQIFGQEGAGNEGNLRFSDGEVQNKKSFEEQIEKYDLKSLEVLEYFTHIRYQTAMKDGVAKEGSLRSSRVLKPSNSFELYIDGELNKNQKDLLDKACLNLRRVGTNRNRGFGRVKVELLDFNNAPSNPKSLTGKRFKITLQTPALLPTSGTDASTVSSEMVISGRKILGMLAAAYLKQNSLQGEAHDDEDFERMFLSGEVKFSDAYPVEDDKVCYPLGRHWVRTKGGTEAFNDYAENEAANYQAIGGYYSADGDAKVSVSTLLDFHNSRNKVNQDDEKINTRILGSNQGAGIYYYEKLAADQSFAFEVEGKEEDLEIIRGLLKDNEQLRLGKASSTNLGRISVVDYAGPFFSFKSDDLNEGEEFVLTFVSPTLLKNENGDYEISDRILKDYLGVSAIQDMRVRTTQVQVFQGKINMQLPEAIAIAPGSSIKVKMTKELIETLKEGKIGEFTHEGYGAFIVEKYHGGSNDTKQSNLSSLLASKKDTNGNSKKQAVESLEDYQNEKLAQFVDIQRECVEATKAGQDDAGSIRGHRNTVMRMIDLCKEIAFNLRGGESDFDKAVANAVKKEEGKASYSKKVLENMETVFGKKKGETWIMDGLNAKTSSYTSAVAKVAYWMTYFNTLKVNNRS